MSTAPNFETSYSCPTLLEAYFSEHSINVTIVPIGCQMAEISLKNGPIVIKKSYGFDFGGDFCSYVHKRKKNRVGQSRKKNLNREVLIRDGRVTGNKQFFFRPN